MSPKNRKIKYVHMPLGERIAFTRTIHVMLKSGLALSDALKTFEKQTSKKIQPIITEMREAVEGGMPLSKAMQQYPRTFPEIFVRLFQAGEVSGRMEETLEQIVLQLRAELSLRNKIRNALAYPSIIVISMFGIGTILVTVVLPRLVELYSGGGFVLPWPTRLIIALTKFFQHNYLIVIPSVVGIIIFLIFLKRIPEGKKMYSFLAIHLPIAHSLSLKMNNARLTRMLQGFLATDVPIVQSLHLLATTTKNIIYKDALNSISQNLKEGEGIAQAFSAYPQLFPPLVQQMIAVGEQSGTMEENLDDLATFFEEEVELELNTLTVLIEPSLILVIGGAVGVVAFAVIWPMYALVNQI